MGDPGFMLGGALGSGIASAALAWLLQRAMPRMHPLGTAAIAVGLLILILVLVVAVVVFQSLASIGAGAPDPIDGPGSLAVNAYILGVIGLVLLAIIGFPAALAAAFARRRRRTGE